MTERTINFHDFTKDRLEAERLDKGAVVFRINNGTGVILSPTQIDALYAWLGGLPKGKAEDKADAL